MLRSNICREYMVNYNMNAILEPPEPKVLAGLTVHFPDLVPLPLLTVPLPACPDECRRNLSIAL